LGLIPATKPNYIKFAIAKPIKIIVYILDPFYLPNSAIVWGRKIIICPPSKQREKNLK
jgi:hypothetical protein